VGHGKWPYRAAVDTIAGLSLRITDMKRFALALSLVCGLAAAAEPEPAGTRTPTMTEVLAASQPSDWRGLDPENTLYLQLATGRVVIELAPGFAPLHAANIRKLAREHYFDGLAIVRSQDNFVVQWGDPDGKRPLGTAKDKLPPEFTVSAKGLPFVRMPDVDGYAPEVGFVDGFPAGRDPKTGEAWIAHCYAMIGAGRGNELDSGNGAELYVVTGQAPRQLDRNIAVVGRVVKGMEWLSTLPRGTGAMGFYEKPEQHVPIQSLRLASEVSVAEREKLQVLRTDTVTFLKLVESRRNRSDDWYKVPAGHIDLCNVPLVTRPQP
jgi:peptidylprolyl isomerase